MDVSNAAVTFPECGKEQSTWEAGTQRLSDEGSRKGLRGERDDSAAQDGGLRKGGKFRSACSSRGWKKNTYVGVGERPSTTNTLGDSQKAHKGNVKGKQDLPVV